MTGPKPKARSAPSAELTLAKATIRAADNLGVNSKTLAAIIGLSEASISRLRKGDFPIKSGSKEFELSVLFVRLYRSLDAIVSGDDSVAKEWIRNPNSALADTPLNLMQKITGLVDVIQYLDSRRALV